MSLNVDDDTMDFTRTPNRSSLEGKKLPSVPNPGTARGKGHIGWTRAERVREMDKGVRQRGSSLLEAFQKAHGVDARWGKVE